jgi:hypothetical protein
MEHRLFDYLTSRQLPTGRRTFAVKAVRKAAEGYGDADIVAHCDASIAFDAEVLQLEMNYHRGKTFGSTARGEASVYDQKIDALFGGIYGVAQGQMVGEDATAKMAGAFLKSVFPAGLAGLVKLEFEEQLARMDLLVKRFDTDLSGDVDTLGVRRHVDGVKALMPRLRAELQKETAAKVSYADVKNALIEGLDKFAAVVFAVLSTYDGDSAQDRERRGNLLAEYHRQNDAVADAYRRHEPVKDVHPDTGEPLAEDETDQDVVEPVS